MKPIVSTLSIVLVIVIAALSFKNKEGGSVSGSVSPAKAASAAWVVSITDTFRTGIRDGRFEFSGVKRGAYSILVIAVPPYKNARRDNVMVNDGAVTNLGEIQLVQ